MSEPHLDDQGGKVVQFGCGILGLIAAIFIVCVQYWDLHDRPLPAPDEISTRSQAYSAGHETAVRLMKTGALKMSDEDQTALAQARFPTNEVHQQEFCRGYRDAFKGLK